jgi:hypothetical protein
MQRPLYQQQDPELRRLKESFVSNLHGTTRWEVFCVLSSLPLCLLVGEWEQQQQQEGRHGGREGRRKGGDGGREGEGRMCQTGSGLD